MSLPLNKRRGRHDVEQHADASDNENASRKRRAFLHTMGRQLRELGTDGTSPQDHGRATFGTSPSGQSIRTTGHNATIPNDAEVSEGEPLPGEDDQLPSGTEDSSSKWLWKSEEVHSTVPSGVATNLTFEDLLEWSQSYFDLWHPAFPFVHAPSLLEWFQGLALNRFDLQNARENDGFLYIITRSIMSIAVMDRRHTAPSARPLPSTLVFQSYNDAIESISKVLIVEGSILSLQALVSVLIFLITMQRYNAASRLEGVAVRIAFQLSLHKCPFTLSGALKKEASLRKRLFWSIFCVDRYICIRLGNPMGIRNEEIEVCYPHEERHIHSEQNNSDRDDRLDFLDFLARHANIRGRIMELRHLSTSQAQKSEPEQAISIEAEHTKWWNAVDEYLSNVETAQPPTLAKSHQVTLIVLRFESILALYRSILAVPKKGAAYNAALQRCISASRSIINTLYKAQQGFGAFDGSPGQHGYQITPLLWPSFTWAVWMSVFIIFFAATEDEIPPQVATRLAKRGIEILQHLSLRNTRWPEACIMAVQNLIRRLDDIRTRRSTRPSRATSVLEQTSQASGGYTRSSQNRSHTASVQTHQSQRFIGDVPINYNQAPPFSHEFAPHNSRFLFPESVETMQNPGVPANVDPFLVTLPPQGPSAVHNIPNHASNYLSGSGTFLGIAQQMSDNPISSDEIMRLFDGEELAPWHGTENLHHRSM